MQALRGAGVDPRYLELELTERIIMSDAEETERKLKRLKELGLSISVDDFGTGYSSLSYLKRFPLDALKIDRGFVIDLKQGSVDEGIVKAIIALAKSLNLTAIAEGVETDLQRAILSKLGCDAYQGYLAGRPAPAADVAALLCSGRVAGVG
jgi:EAL domain-containing protein (putative c-di-GMP-specific phosphodiesterase class I)